jgi:hypothetical protein
MFSPFIEPRARRIVIMVQLRLDTLNICDVEWRREPNHGDLNAE